MATHNGYRNIARYPTLWNVSWTVGGGATVPSATPEQLNIQSDAAGTAILRAAIAFDPTAPGWINEGMLGGAHTYGLLALYVAHPTYPGTLLVRKPASALTAGMTCAQLDTAWTGATQTPAATTLTIDRGGRWYMFMGVDNAAVSDGLLFGLDLSGVGAHAVEAALGSIASGQPATMMLFYDAGLRTVYDADDPARPDIAALLDYLDGTRPAYVEITGSTIGHDEIAPAVPAVDVSELVRAGGEIFLRAAVDPLQPWATGTAPFGTLSIAAPSDLAASNIIDVAQYSRIGGTPVTFEMALVQPDNAARLAEMATIAAVAGHAEQNGQSVDVELLAPVARDLDGVLTGFWPGVTSGTVPAGLEYTDESAASVLYDLLLNCCPSTRWRDCLPLDWFWLLTRFGGTWGGVVITEADAAAETSVRSLWDKMLATLCLHSGQDLDGRMAVWHPAAYRPSMRAWTLDPLEEHASGIRLIGLEAEQYDIVEIPYTSGGTDYTDEYSADTSLAALESGRRYSHPWPVAYLDTQTAPAWPAFPLVRGSILRQLSQRLLAPAVKLTFTTGLRGLTWRLGDQLIVSADVLGLDAVPFMVTGLSAAPLAATCDVEAVHYSGWPGGHSLFQGTAPLGLYRWRRHQGWIDRVSAYENPTLDNLSWGTDLLPSLSLGGPGDTFGTAAYGSWEGAAMWIEETGAVDGNGVQTTAVTYAGVALPTAAGTRPNQADVQIGLQTTGVDLIGDAEYDWLWRWWSTSLGEGLALLVRNPYAPAVCPDADAQILLAHCSNCNPGIGLWGGANIVASLALPYGFPGHNITGTEVYGIHSISVSWDAEDSARLFVGQRLIGTLTSTPAPGSMNQFDIRTPSTISVEAFINNFCTRLIYNATPPTAATMLPDDGLDPYYP